jgi:hypothetical protein
MQLTFLAASDGTRMAKSFALSSGTIVTTPYPHARRFWSFSRNAADLNQLHALLVTHAEAGHCLLKGALLDRPLRHESRAGRTDANAPTDLLVLDLDFDQGFASIDTFLEAIGLAGVSYVLHHSSSAGITAKPGLRAHVFVPLAPVAPVQLKLWLRHLNLTVPGLRGQVTLSANGMTPRWPLDVTSCQNDKLLFIADPVVGGLEDPLAGRRFELCHRGIASIDLRTDQLDPGAVQREADAQVSELRAKAGLPAREPRYIALTGRERLLANPEPATVTGVRRARGFVYLNLNGGDSWAYFFPESNPEILYSFKGEPPVQLAHIAPDLWEQVRPCDPFAAVA